MTSGCDTCGRSPRQAATCSFGGCVYDPGKAPVKPLDLTNPAAVMKARRKIVAAVERDVEEGTDHVLRSLDRFYES